jgi:hypothetical protein
LTQLSSATPPPPKLIRYGDDAAVEHLAAWILEPALIAPGDTLKMLLPDPSVRTLKNLQNTLIEKKKDRELRESLAWEALDSDECCRRACEFFHDLSRIAGGEEPKNAGWKKDGGQGGPLVFIATHVKKA